MIIFMTPEVVLVEEILLFLHSYLSKRKMSVRFKMMLSKMGNDRIRCKIYIHQP